jgi:hypothetical protein
MADRGSPEMSVVIATPDRYDAIRKTIEHLRAQTVAHRLELVIVAPSARQLGLDASELELFCRFRVVESGPGRNWGEANAVGVRQAGAPLVVLAEDHSYPDPDWAAALIAAHREPWAAVGPAVRAANPGSLVGWADLLIGFAPWIEPAPAGRVQLLPPRNSSYKRAILLEYGRDLAAMLEAEPVLHRDLRARGHELYLEPAARSAHVGFTRLSSWTRAEFLYGRIFAATRARSWSAARRVLYTGGGFLIPGVFLWRLRRDVRRVGRHHRLLPRVLPALIFGLILNAMGQIVGYGCGAGDAVQRSTPLAFVHER